MFLITALLLTAQAAEPNTTPPPPAPPAAATPAPTPAPTRAPRVCRVTEVTGSRIAVRRVCRTAEEWRRQDQELNQDMREQRNGTPSPVTSDLTPT